MLITDKFVFIHQPKCGGTFVTEVLKRIHSKHGTAGGVGPLIDTAVDGTKHRDCRGIPSEHRHKSILAVRRNPYDRYVSQYHFKWWVGREAGFGLDLGELKRKYAHYPEITLAEFIEIMSARQHLPENPEIRLTERLGWHSAQFVHLYFKNPAQIAGRINGGDGAGIDYEQEMFPVRFLRADALNHDLHDYLADVGYPARAIKFIHKWGRVQPPEGTSRKEYHWQRSYTPELKEYVRRRENLLFSRFPDFDV